MTSRSALLLSALLLGTMVPGRPLRAQSVDSGLWWSVSVGAGGSRLTCDLCDRRRDLGPTVEAALGAYARPGLRVGVDGGAWTHRAGDVRETVYLAGLAAELHPRPDRGLHLVGGIGWAGFRAEEFGYDAVRLRVGVGWDLPLAGRWSVGNRVVLDAASFGTLRNGPDSVARDVGLSVVRASVHLRNR